MSDRRMALSPAFLALSLLILTSGSWGKSISRRRLDDNTYSDGGSSRNGSSKESGSSSSSSSGSSKTGTTNSKDSQTSEDSKTTSGSSSSKSLQSNRIQAATNQGSVTGDPVLTAFDGQRFEFHGEADRYYDLVSEKGVFQISTQLKPARMFDHDGTYMRAIALQQQNAQIIVEAMTDYDEDLAVTVNGELLAVLDTPTQTTSRLVPLSSGGFLQLVWQRFAPGIGPLVVARSDSFEARISLTAPFPDKGGVLQPNYLNLNVTLLRDPSVDLQGVLGETYNPLRQSSRQHSAPKYPLFDDSKYQIDGFFSGPVAHTMASLAKTIAVQPPVTSSKSSQ